MNAPDRPKTSYEMYRAMAEHYHQGPSHAALVTLLFRMTMELEALREALSSPQTPESVREAYREAYKRTAVLSHNAAGPTGGAEKILREFLPWEGSDDRFASEMAMMKRLGTTPEEQQALREKMEEVEMYT
ncbi:hypothetical protein [Archangium lansingense]|uniref:Uncharacterized protein n=1 Tax=Archangium lansingense TaxID=2995310 RepID=A0ABT4APM1_9BACT|nr:hypothetical protein [Archangium lansinium]MCY1083624.1 hypothetical protein [Archangium lansinium]